MKKGDIVNLKEGEILAECTRHASQEQINLIEKVVSDTFTVSSTQMIESCCVVFEILQFEETGHVNFYAENFNVLLEKGELNIAKLMKESEQAMMAGMFM